ncbi:hypothetical protein E4582_01585 [Luteimonas yindakuii]|uniref:Uncharacterized protein n=1 Tax=Luteimonas yindakuii TaxID=2565782 RepID=A0A4Z1R3V7_9GAMM|nr:hypothetical protein [Luteimonas yindakuii]TKS53596.1 hypothetical protein E4582_01585 [Luteimonas yindakuii]
MDHSCIDIYITRDVDGYVVAPAGTCLPEDAMSALGGVVHGWMQQVGEASRLPAWRGVRRDLDACGYSVLSDEDFAALLLPGELAPPPMPLCMQPSVGVVAAAA